MLREVPFGGDGDFSQKALIDRINSDLGNDLGNLLNRLIGMSGKYNDGVISSANVEKYYANELKEVNDSLDKLEPLLFDMQIHRYLEELWRPLSVANKSIDKYQPWNLMKEGKNEEALALNGLIANILAKVAIMLHPVMPKTTDIISKALGFSIDVASYTKLIKQKDGLLDEFTISKTPPLFPRIEEMLLEEAQPAAKEESKKEKKKETKEQSVGVITIDEFFKTELKIGVIIEAEEVAKSKKLLKLKVDLGEEKPRQVIAGIKEWYAPQDLIGTQACVVANLKPAKLMGMLSEGMLLAAKDDSGLSLIRPEKQKAVGTKIS
jgi:methionyl-tRNA synthetase